MSAREGNLTLRPRIFKFELVGSCYVSAVQRRRGRAGGTKLLTPFTTDALRCTVVPRPRLIVLRKNPSFGFTSDFYVIDRLLMF